MSGIDIIILIIIGVLVSLKFYGLLMPYLNNEIFSMVGMFIIAYFSSQFILSMIFKPFKIIVGGTVVNKILGAIIGALEMTLFISILAYFMRYNQLYVQFSQKSQVLKQIENITFPIYDGLFKK